MTGTGDEQQPASPPKKTPPKEDDIVDDDDIEHKDIKNDGPQDLPKGLVSVVERAIKSLAVWALPKGGEQAHRDDNRETGSPS